MKNIIVLLSLIAASFISNAQDWQWSYPIYADWWHGAGVNCTDNQNNIYITGYFSTSNAFFPTDTLSTNGNSDFYIVKNDADGNILWIKQFGGNNTSSCFEGIAIKYDSNNNYLYGIGSFCGTTILGQDTLISNGNADAFIAKFDTAGNVIWAKRGGGLTRDGFNVETIDDSGNVYLYGASLDSATFGMNSVVPGGFLAKYDSAGTNIWVKNVCNVANPITNGIDYGAASIILENGFLYTAGTASDDTLMIDTISIETPDIYGSLFAKFDLNGNVQWVKSLGHPVASLRGACKDNNGNIFLIGTFFSDSAQFDSVMLYNNGLRDAFIAKYDTSGNFHWVRQLSATAGSEAWGIDVTSNGTVYVVGKFSGTATFSSNITAGTSNDMFLAHYDSGGSCIGVVNFGIADATSVIVDNNDVPTVAGTFNGTVQIGGNTLSQQVGTWGVYIAKHDAITGEEEAPRLANSNQLLIYANPNTGKCTITIPDEFKHEDNLTLQIFDATGKLLQRTQIEMTDGKIKLNIEAQAKGVYNAVLSNGRKNYSGRIVFE